MPADVTIALLTKDAGPLLDRVIAGIERQQTPRSIERIAVDSGSTDQTCRRLTDAGFIVMPYDAPEFDFGIAREMAYTVATGTFVANLSQDAVPAQETWLENLLRPFADDAVAVSCGRSVPDPDRGFDQFAWERNGRFYFTREFRTFTRRYGRGVSFANSAVRRDVWKQLHFDSIALSEDFQFQMKLADTQYTVAFVDDAPVLHHHNYDRRNLYARCRNEGMAFRELGCPYGIGDLVLDVTRPGIWIQWLRELAYGRMRTPAERWFPLIRPAAVYAGNRPRTAFAHYEPKTESDR